MRKLTILLALLVLALMPTVARAENFTWDAGEPKQGFHGFLQCTGTIQVGDDRVTITHYVGYDANQPVESEHAWQIRMCKILQQRDVPNWFLYQRDGLVVSPDDVKITYRLMP